MRCNLRKSLFPTNSTRSLANTPFELILVTRPVNNIPQFMPDAWFAPEDSIWIPLLLDRKQTWVVASVVVLLPVWVGRIGLAKVCTHSRGKLFQRRHARIAKFGGEGIFLRHTQGCPNATQNCVAACQLHGRSLVYVVNLPACTQVFLHAGRTALLPVGTCAFRTPAPLTR